MNIVAVACVRDEIDVIEAFVRHNLAFVSRLIVLDNGSTDGTLGVLNALEREGLPIDVLEDRSLGKFLSQRVNRLAQEHAIGRYRAEWVLPLDADEFLVLQEGHRLVPEDAPPDQPLNLRWRTYVPDEKDDLREINPVVRIRHRLVEEGWPWVKVVVPAALLGRPGAAICQGSHALELHGRVCEGMSAGHACLAHFPIRSRGQFVSKTVIGHLQNEVMPHRPSSWGFHHRDNFEQMKQDPDFFLAHFAEPARRYSMPSSDAASFVPRVVEEPLAFRGGPLRHTPALRENVQTWSPMLHYVQSLAREHALLKGSLTEDGRLSQEHFAGTFRFVIEQLHQRDCQLDGQATLTNRLQEQLRETEARLSAALEQQRVLERRVQESTTQLSGFHRSWTYTVGNLVRAPWKPLWRYWGAYRRRTESCAP